ncbi:MAG: arginyltransferase [Hyphomicrobiales bacterium]|nr:arginyltransferase [Hyphomicrobiales bacterium]
MKHHAMPYAHYFFATAPLPCPYLPNRTERRLVTELAGRHADALHDMLSQSGFRRSHCLAYVPVCRDCAACVAVRIRALEFTPTRGQRRTWSRNDDLIVLVTQAIASEEHYSVFRAYQVHRHSGGEMARMTFYDYQTLVEDTPVDTSILEVRTTSGQLLGACLVDNMRDGLSAVYSFFDPKEVKRSLGTYMILMLIERAKSLRLPYVYLGFWIADCQKMSYKSQFKPMEIFSPEGWVLYDTSADPSSGP